MDTCHCPLCGGRMRQVGVQAKAVMKEMWQCKECGESYYEWAYGVLTHTGSPNRPSKPLWDALVAATTDEHKSVPADGIEARLAEVERHVGRLDARFEKTMELVVEYVLSKRGCY